MADSRGPECTAVVGLLLGLTWTFTSLRVYVRICLGKNWAVDDSLLLATLAFFTVYAACSLAGIAKGIGRHYADIPQDDIPKALMFWFLCELLYVITTVFLRLSIAIFLLRICMKRAQKVIIYITVIGVVIFSTFYFFLSIFQCQPTSYFWTQPIGGVGSCLKPSLVPDATIAHSAVSGAADFILGLLPIWLIWDLKMNFRTKLSVAGVLSLGVLAGISTVIRIPYVLNQQIADDFLYGTVDVAIWSIVEPGLGIAAASASALRPLFKKFLDLSVSATNRSHGDAHPSAYPSNRGGGTGTIGANDDVEIALGGGSLTVTSSTPKPRDRYEREKSVWIISRSESSTSSGEELAGKGGIQIHKTVEVRRGIGTEEDSESSTKFSPPTLW